jgi:hypothetical protein
MTILLRPLYRQSRHRQMSMLVFLWSRLAKISILGCFLCSTYIPSFSVPLLLPPHTDLSLGQHLPRTQCCLGCRESRRRYLHRYQEARYHRHPARFPPPAFKPNRFRPVHGRPFHPEIPLDRSIRVRLRAVTRRPYLIGRPPLLLVCARVSLTAFFGFKLASCVAQKAQLSCLVQQLTVECFLD